MTAKGGSKQQVTLYYMSQHFGICTPVDQIRGITVNEKVAWSGSISAQGSFTIDNANLFGGPTKQGGVKGTVYFLPGRAEQVLPDNLAEKLGRADGADCPGYRGLASAFFTGPADGQPGFYWTANDPYLPGVWIKVTRRPRGLNQDYAMVPRQNSANEFPVTIATDNPTGRPYAFSTDGATLYQIDADTFAMWSMDSQTLLKSATLDHSTTGDVAISPDRIYAQTGPFFDPVLGSFDLGGGDYQELVATAGFPQFTSGCTWAASKVCFFNPTNTSASVVYDPANASITAYAVTFEPTGYCTDATDPEAGWVVGTNAISTNGLYLAHIASATTFTISGGFDGVAYVMDNGEGKLLVWQQDNFLLIDKTTHLVTATAAVSGGSSVAVNAFRTVTPGASTIWMGNLEYDTRTLALIRTVDPDLWVTGEWHVQSTIYSPYLHALVTWPAFLSPDLVFRLLDRDAEDANPAHIIYECLTNTDWGMGSPETLIDTDAFNAVAVELFNEPLGLSMIWTKQATIQDFIQEVLDHIQATLFVDPQNGLLTLKLIRGDYDVDTLPTISPSTANLSNFGRKLWGDIVNEINVTWTNPDNEQDETVTAHDLASITTQGGIVSDSRNYYGVRYSDLAMRLAARDLRSAAAPLATCDVELDRSYWALRPASVIRVDWPQYGLDGVVMRLTSIDYGKPGDPTIKCSLIEDVFGLDVADYVAPPSTLWEDTSSAPLPMTEQLALTLPYYLTAQGVTSLSGATYPEVLAGVLGASSNADTFGYELWGQVTLADGSTEWQSLASLNLVGHGELSANLPAEATSSTVSLTSVIGTPPERNSIAIIGDGTEAQNELALITAASTAFTLSRGILDTVPKAWTAGTPVWFITTDQLIEDPTVRSAGELVEYRLLTRTSKGLLSLFAATSLTATLTNRPWLPQRPANVTIGSVQFNDISTPVDMTARADPWVTVTWSNRNRLLEDSQVLKWTDSTVTPETAQTTTVTVYGTDGTTVISTHTGITGTTYNVPDADLGLGEKVLIVPTSSRTDADGTFASLQGHGVWVELHAASPASDASSGSATASFASSLISGSSLATSAVAAAALVGTTTTVGPGGPFTTTGLIGLPDVLASGDFTAGAELDIRQITAWSGANATYTGLACFLGGTVVNGSKIKPVLYADSAGVPGALIATGTEYTLVAADAMTTKTLAFASPPTLIAGTKYWIGWITDSGNHFRAYAGANGTKWVSNTYASGAPSTAPTMNNSTNTIVSKAMVSVAVGVAGFWDQESQVDYFLAADEVVLIPITTPASGTCSADTLVLRLAGTVTVGGKMKGVIYSDSSGAPSTRIATGSEVTVATADSELSSTFSGVTLQPSTTYWIGCHSDNASHVVGMPGTTKRQTGFTYGSGPPSTLGAMSGDTTVAGFYLRFS